MRKRVALAVVELGLTIGLIYLLKVMFFGFGPGPDARVIGPDFRPIRNFLVTFEDGRQARTDGDGRFYFPRDAVGLPVPRGLGLLRTGGYTGANPARTFDYAPVVDYVFSVKGLGGPSNPSTVLFKVVDFHSDAGTQEHIYTRSPSPTWKSTPLTATVPTEGATVHGWPCAIVLKELFVVPLTRKDEFYLTRRVSGPTIFIDINIGRPTGRSPDTTI
ncbi:MAG: hypothetical protein ACHQ50_09885 [Fimbriimonadales bacterium]